MRVWVKYECFVDVDVMFLRQGLIADSPYTFVDGVLRDGDDEEIELVEPVVEDSCVEVLVETNMLEVEGADPEIQELEECGGGYLSDSDDGNCFTIDGDGDKHIVEM